MTPPDKPPRLPSPAPLARLAAKAGAKAFARYGFAEQTLITRWSAIMGETLGAMTLPVKLTFPRGARDQGTLRIMAEGAAAFELQHLLPQVIQRINGVFGYPAVKTISIVQGPAQRAAPERPRAAPLDPESARELAAALSPVQDEGLRKSLDRLGRALYARRVR